MGTDRSLYNLQKIKDNMDRGNLFLDSYPVQLHFLMIDKCNVKCIMCGGDYFRSNSGRMITLDKFKTMAANLKFENVRAVVLAGAGDPMLNRDLVPIVQFMNSAYPQISISITTNGLGLTGPITRSLLDCMISQVNISINSATQPTYKRIMQIDGFDAVCRNARTFDDLRKQSGKSVSLQFSAAINRLNIEEMSRLVELARETGADSINLFYTRFYPERIRNLNIDNPEDRLKNEDSLFYHQQLSDDRMEKAKTLAQRYGIRMTHEPLFKEHAAPCACTWPMIQLMVGFDGEVYPCGGSEVHFREKVEKGIYDFGNALTGPVDVFWNSEAYRALRISSRQGETCLVSECKCCANVISPNDVRSHIMQWDQEGAEAVQPQPIATLPLVSVIVPTYNRPDQLVMAVKSILAQTYGNVEIIVVNDNGADVADRLAPLNIANNINYIEHSKNSGLAAARNTGIRGAQGKYIAYLDDDDLFYPDHLDTLVRFLEAGNHKVAYTDACRAHQVRQNGEYVVVNRDVPYSLDFDYNRILETNFVPVLCFVHARSCFNEVGLFDESLMRLEDWDLWIRLSRKYRFEHIKKITCEFSWRVDGSSMSSAQDQAFAVARAHIAGKYGLGQPAASPLPRYAGKAVPALVSIVILTFNQLRFTKECVVSIRKNTPEPHEIIFVDNSSTDGTVKWLRQIVKDNPSYHLIANNKNLGFSKGCNQGIAASSGEYILLLNNDVVVTKGWLSGMLECLKSDPDCGLVGPMTNTISGIQKVDSVPYTTMVKMEGFAEEFREKHRHRRIPSRRLVGFCLLFRRALVEKTGLLDERFGSGNFEDDDYCLRAVLAGYRNSIAGDVFIHHYGSRSFIGNRVDYSASLSGNKKLFNEKWTGINSSSLLGIKTIVLNAVEIARELHEQGRLDRAVDALVDAVKHAPDALEIYCCLAELFLEDHKYQEALNSLKSMPETAIQSERALTLTGYAMEGMELYGDAEKHADGVLAMHARSAMALNLKGMISYKQGDSAAAEQFFQSACEADPGYGEPFTNRGVIKWAAGQKDEALNLLEKGFVLSPAVPDMGTLYYSAATDLEQFATAEKLLREAKMLHPNNKHIAFLLIDSLLKQAGYEKAMQEIEQAMILFGIDDGILKAALDVRAKLGPKEPGKTAPKRQTLSLCMIVKNEEAHLAKCLMSVKDVADEMIVVDTGSTDKTRDIAAAFGARVFDFTWTNDFSEARNVSLSKASGDWILVLDADEVVSTLDHPRIREVVAGKDRTTAYSFVTRNYVDFMGMHGWHKNDGRYREEAGKGWINSEKVRLFPRISGARFSNPVHEMVESSLRTLQKAVLPVGIPIHHYGHLDTEKRKNKRALYLELGKSKLRELGKDDPKTLWEIGIQELVLGNYENALSRFTELLSLDHGLLREDPKLANIFMQTGICYLCLRKYHEALGPLKQALQLDPSLKEAHVNLALTLLYLGNASEAVAVLEKLHALDAGFTNCEYLLALALVCDGRLDSGGRLMKTFGRTGSPFHEFAALLVQELRSLGRQAYGTAILESLDQNGRLTPHGQHDHDTPQPRKPGLVSIVLRLTKDLEAGKKCLLAIQQHTLEPHEVIFMVPRLFPPALKWVKKLGRENHNYTVVKHSGPHNFSQEVNQGIQASSGEFVLLLDDHVRVTEGWLTGMLECLQTSSVTGVIGPMTDNISSPQSIGSREFSPGGDLAKFAAAFRIRNRHHRISQQQIAGICMLFRHSLLEKIDLFDEELRSGMFSDDDFCLRAALDGFHNLIAGDVFVHYPASGDYFRDLYNSKKVFDTKWRAISTESNLGKNIVTLKMIETSSSWYHQKQQIDKAIAWLAEGVKYAPDDPRIYQSLALLLIDAKLFQDSLDALKAMPEQAKQEAKSLELFGFCFEGLGRIDEANAHADRLLAIEPASAPALNIKGMLAYKHGDRTAAEGFFQQASESDPGYGEPLTNLGVMKWADNKKGEALDLLERGFLLAPTVTDSVTLYHNAVTSLEEFARAELFFREAKLLHPRNKRVFFLFIDVLLQQEKYSEAMQEVEEALLAFDLDDGIIPAALQIRGKIGVQQPPAPPVKRGTLSLCMIVKNEEAHLAKCLMSVKDIVDEMIVVDTGSTDQTKDIATAFGARVFDFTWANDFSEARNISLSKASGDWILVLDGDEALSPSDHSALADIVHSKPGKPAAYSIVTRNYTNLASVQGWTANDGCYTREEVGSGWHPSTKVRLFSNDKRIQFRNAVHEMVEPSLLEAGISIKPCGIPVHHYGKLNADKTAEKGEDYYLLGRKKLAETGGDAKAIHELAVQASELHRYSESVELWQKLIDLQPNNATAYFNIGYSHLKLNQYNETIRASKKALELNPDLKEAVLNYASSELVIGDIDQAITSLSNVLDRVPDYPPAIGLLAASFFMNGDREKALGHLKKLTKMGYDCADYLYDLADMLTSERRFKEAVQLLEGAMESHNTHQDTQFLLARCREMIRNNDHQQSEQLGAAI